jgi:hypothetical protein
MEFSPIQTTCRLAEIMDRSSGYKNKLDDTNQIRLAEIVSLLIQTRMAEAEPVIQSRY